MLFRGAFRRNLRFREPCFVRHSTSITSLAHFCKCSFEFTEAIENRRKCVHNREVARVVFLFILLAGACSAQSLKDCKTIFIQPMPESLDRFLSADISKWGVIKVVAAKAQADCVASYGREANRIVARLSGNTVPPENSLPSYFNGFGYSTSAEIEIVHRASSFYVWSDSKTDGLSLASGPKTLARRLVSQLKRDY